MHFGWIDLLLAMGVASVGLSHQFNPIYLALAHEFVHVGTRPKLV